MSLPSTYKHAIFKEAGGPLTIEDTPITAPGAGEVLVKVEACGVWCVPIYPFLCGWLGLTPRSYSDTIAQAHGIKGQLYVHRIDHPQCVH